MKIAYLDCLSGISGDMTLAALVDAGVDLAAVNEGIASLGLPGNVRLVASQVQRRGFRATHIQVLHEPEHKHRHLQQITAMIEGSKLNDRQKTLAKQVFTRLAEAEAKVHGTTPDHVHFHEVGAVDSIADLVGSAIGWDLLGVERIICSPVPTGTGFVQIAHGRCSVPAPAVAELLKNIPLALSTVPFELTTPTGAAIVASLAHSFGPLPAMKIERIGYGAGTRDMADQANVLRLLVGEAVESQPLEDEAWMLETNLDDTSGELIGHAISQLWEAGALDVFTTAIQMKKNRPGVLLSVLCEAARREAMEEILFRETSTLGVRRYPVSRRKLRREKQSVDTPWGLVEGVVAWIDGDARSFSPEYESCRQRSAEHGVPLQDVYEAARRAWSK